MNKPSHKALIQLQKLVELTADNDADLNITLLYTKAFRDTMSGQVIGLWSRGAPTLSIGGAVEDHMNESFSKTD